ncbi:hypothetical protein ROS62_25380 [Streptomyces sp. DSM 41972]|uniref:Lipoprotein n=1 Tax=Streptomyces althioticus subsp. attaecolombicae TaxID=3075534 RepID=A0ABU3I512_9ACTN|nr:hypothetical protein [Streptomyces sp. DSM 41972]SCD31714.1 hypothetical protein GA0115245_10223 [Streptomyces sp. di188]SCE13707.1 hypothetical protein GA0115238_15873 [Streptomyces sp. di50b]
MGKRRLALCAGVLAVTASGPAACAAYAADGGDVSVVPAAPAPGGDIALRVTGCDAREAVAQSPALVSDARLTPDDGGDGLAGDGRVRSTVTAGTYTVTVTCDGTEHRGAVQVVRKQTPAAGAEPAARPSPVAPVNAGAGGAARDLAGRPEQRGPGTAQTVVALALAGTAALTVHRAARRQARRGRRTG